MSSKIPGLPEGKLVRGGGKGKGKKLGEGRVLWMVSGRPVPGQRQWANDSGQRTAGAAAVVIVGKHLPIVSG